MAPGTVIQPGGRYTWNFTMTAPAAAGNYAPKYRMVSGSNWFGDTATASVAVGEVNYDADMVSSTIPAQMVKGKAYSVTVTVGNTGNVPWSGGDNYMLGAVEGSSAATFSGGGISLPQGATVMPGEHYKFSFTMTAPNTIDGYTVKYRMVKGSVWFGDMLSKTVTVKTGTAI